MGRNMITETDYNSRWWGAPFGKVTDAAFFALPPDQIRAQLAPFSVVEFSAAENSATLAGQLARAGFWWADSQLSFRLNLRRFAKAEPPKHVARITLRSARQAQFSIAADDLPLFKAERFLRLHGVKPARLAQRYANWANDLIAAHPDCCFEAFDGTRSIGWFLGRALNPSSIELTLAMSRPETTATGGQLYEAAQYAYARLGFRLGQAAFSIHNTDVLNLYSHLGARFQAPTHFWFWQQPPAAMQAGGFAP